MSLSRYIVTRSITMFLVFLVSIIFFFIFVRALPIPLSGGSLFLPSQTDPFLMSVLRNQDDPRFTGFIEITIRTFGLDKPLIPDQLILFLKNVFTFDFGYSLYSNRKVLDEILADLV
jgi:ABC-type dipeptide/oligopeptide/nickel transport system permease component